MRHVKEKRCMRPIFSPVPGHNRQIPVFMCQHTAAAHTLFIPFAFNIYYLLIFVLSISCQVLRSCSGPFQLVHIVSHRIYCAHSDSSMCVAHPIVLILRTTFDIAARHRTTCIRLKAKDANKKIANKPCTGSKRWCRHHIVLHKTVGHVATGNIIAMCVLLNLLCVSYKESFALSARANFLFDFQPSLDSLYGYVSSLQRM